VYQRTSSEKKTHRREEIIPSLIPEKKLQDRTYKALLQFKSTDNPIKMGKEYEQMFLS
jgi:hypothetical protein